MNRKLLILTGSLMAFTSAWVILDLVIGSAEERAFVAVHIGDSEQQLVATLNGYGIDYQKETQAKKTTYIHEGRFLDLCYYFVVDGKVVERGTD